MSTNVSILAEIPEELHQSLQNYLDDHPTWDQDQVFAAALSLFLLENNKEGDALSPENPTEAYPRVYLETLFQV